jgi:hypothetical protein
VGQSDAASHIGQRRLAGRLQHAAGEQPAAQPYWVYLEQPGHPVGQSGGVGVQPLGAVEQMLHRVVGRVTDVRLRVDDQPGLPLRGQHVASMQVGDQQHRQVGFGRQRAEQGHPGARQPRVDEVRVGGGLLLELGRPLVGHVAQRPERCRRWRKDPQPAQQTGDHLVLLRLRPDGQGRAGSTPLEQQRDGAGRALGRV